MYPLLSTADMTLMTLNRWLIYIILPAMPLAEDKVTSLYRITAYSEDTITINGNEHRRSLVLTANDIHDPWQVASLDQLDADSLAPVLASKPAVVLLGTGVRQQFPTAEIYAIFGHQGIGLEVMDNGALCRTFNILVAEDRDVTAAILLGN